MGSITISPSLLRRFWAMVDNKKHTECWEWMGQKKFGYGVIAIERKSVKATRLMYYFFKGFVPETKLIMHSCDNPSCVNPSHLSLGTNQENINDSINKGRSARGERTGRAKLTEEQVREIRRTYHNGTASTYELSKVYKIDPSNVFRIINREYWKHVK